MRRKQKGQSVLEYTLLLAAIIAVLLAVIFGGFQGKLQNVYNTTSNASNTSLENATQAGAGIFGS